VYAASVYITTPARMKLYWVPTRYHTEPSLSLDYSCFN